MKQCYLGITVSHSNYTIYYKIILPPPPNESFSPNLQGKNVKFDTSIVKIGHLLGKMLPLTNLIKEFVIVLVF